MREDRSDGKFETFSAIFSTWSHFESRTSAEFGQSRARGRFCPGYLPYKTKKDLDFLLSRVE